MNLEWTVQPNDATKVRALVQRFEGDWLIVERRTRNLGKKRPDFTKERIWQILVSCLLTTQQKSGPGEAVDRFTQRRPFPLAYNLCRRSQDVVALTQKVIAAFGGIRRRLTISQEIAENLDRLERGYWTDLLDLLARTDAAADPGFERDAAHAVDEALRGFGPKQARNFLQWFGVTRFEIPIDSRITKWLNREVLAFPLNATLLSDSTYYDLVSDGIIALCRRAEVLPCLFDAAVFASFDRRRAMPTRPLVGV
jgi:hypothetical protein